MTDTNAPERILTECPEHMFAREGIHIDNGKVSRVKLERDPFSSDAAKCFGPLWVRADLLTTAQARIAALETERDQARRTAEYWKANHLAGNERIAALETAEAEMRERCAKLAYSDDPDDTIDRPWEHWGEYRNMCTAQTVGKEIAAAIRALPLATEQTP